MAAPRRRAISSNLFTGSEQGQAEPAHPEPPRASEQVASEQREPLRAAQAPESRATSRIGAHRYQRLNLYVTSEQLRNVKRLQAEALGADLPLGQRGPSVVMAAALAQFLDLPAPARLAAIEKLLRP